MERGRESPFATSAAAEDQGQPPGQSLVHRGIITDDEYASALEHSRRSGQSLWSALRNLSPILPRHGKAHAAGAPQSGPSAGGAAEPGELADAFTALTESESIPTLVSHLFEEAVRFGATDIHLDPTTSGVRVRLRIDGLLHDVGLLPEEVGRHARSRIKVLAGMDLLEKREPQDGHIMLRAEGGHRDFRIATLLTGLGERLVVRFHQEAERGRMLDALGLEPEQVDAVSRMLASPQGLILVAGPIGSGKTTTLYACLRAIGTPTRNIMTIEDPIEYQLDGINQVEVRPNLGLTFARGLRAILRQDPDAVMVGEIRDRSTARIAVRAAASGALVLSSTHAADAQGVLRALANYRIPPHRVAESLVGVVLQRLVRMVCMRCRRPLDLDRATADTLAAWGLSDQEVARAQLVQPVGCPDCFGTGYRGRIGVFDVIEADGSTRELGDRAGGGETVRGPWGVASGPADGLRRAAVRKVAQGVTTLEEIHRVLTAPPPGIGTRLARLSPAGSGS